MRSIVTVIFAAALIAAPAISKAAPRGIDDCEKIQAADAYNQCLASFGPVAKGHHGTSDGVEADSQDAEANTGGTNDAVTKAASNEEFSRGHGRHHASRHHSRYARHGSARHGWARHSHGHHTGTAEHMHGKGKRLAFNVVSGHTHLR